MARAWHVVFNREDYYHRQVLEAARYITDTKNNLRCAIALESEGDIDPEIYDHVYMGIYHLGIPVHSELIHNPALELVLEHSKWQLK